MTIIGLGQAGCNIAEMYEDLKNDTYQVKLIDSEIEGENCFSVPKYTNPEECEKNFPDISNFLYDCHKNILMFIGGGGNISAASLKILSCIKDRNIHIVYIRPEPLLLGEIGNLHEKVVCNVLQEYTRSGLFKSITLIDNLSVENIAGDVPVVDYFKELNNLIFKTIYGLNKSAMMPKIVESYSPPKNISCIGTYGIYLYDQDDEKFFYNLKNVDNKCYYFFINEEQLKTDKKLFKEIKNLLKKKVVDNVKISYIIHATSSEQNYCLITATSSQIQE